MPSNKDLIADINDLTEQLGKLTGNELEPFDTSGMNNEKLAELASDLRAKVQDAEKDTAADKAAAEQAEKDKAAAAAKPKRPPYWVKEGKAVTTKRGILSDGAEIKAKDLAGGDQRLYELVKSGHVGKR